MRTYATRAALTGLAKRGHAYVAFGAVSANARYWQTPLHAESAPIAHGLPSGAQSAEEVPMPTYDYQCRKCGAVVEQVAPADGRTALRHEADGGKLWRLFSPPGLVFKGSGWAKKDRKAEGKNAAR